MTDVGFKIVMTKDAQINEESKTPLSFGKEAGGEAQLSIIIINYNTFELTCKCIQSLYDKLAGLTYEIILVDNASKECGNLYQTPSTFFTELEQTILKFV